MRLSFLGLILIFSFASAVFAFTPLATVEAGIIPCGLSKDDPDQPGDQTAICTLCHFIVGISNIMTLMRNVMTAIAIAVIFAMAVVYVTSGGDEGRMHFAKAGIAASLIGFAIILLAWVIVNFVLTIPIFSGSGLVKTDWSTFTCNTTSTSTP